MSYGLTARVYINRARKDNLTRDIDECNDMLKWYERRLLALCSDNAVSVMGEYGEPIPKYEYLANEVPNMLEEIAEYAGRLALLEAALMSDELEDE